MWDKKSDAEICLFNRIGFNVHATSIVLIGIYLKRMDSTREHCVLR